MKIKLPWTKEEPKTEEQQQAARYCKKCGRPLASTSKYDLCERCRRKEAGWLRNALMGVGAALALVLGPLKKPLLSLLKSYSKRA